MWNIVGLGNPGKKYKLTRHNLGFMVLDRLVEKNNLRFKKRRIKYSAAVAGGMIGIINVLLIKPLTFVNLSGTALKKIQNSSGKFDYEKLLIVCDDIDLNTGKIRIARKGGSGGHNGIESIIENLGTKNFPRLKIGIGQNINCDAAEYVLQKFNEDEKIIIRKSVENACEAINLIITEGIDKAMNEFN